MNRVENSKDFIFSKKGEMPEHIESVLAQIQPGVLEALKIVKTQVGAGVPLTEFRVINLVLPYEIKKIKQSRLTYFEFRNRNGLYALEHLTPSEKKVLREAFLAQGYLMMVNSKYTLDRKMLKINLTDIKNALNKDAFKLERLEYYNKHSNDSLKELDAKALNELVKKKRYFG